MYERYWREKVAEYDKIRKAGNVEIRYKGRRIYVICPANKEFARVAKQLMGRYRKATGIWTFSRRCEEMVVNLCTRVWPGRVQIVGPNEPILR